MKHAHNDDRRTLDEIAELLTSISRDLPRLHDFAHTAGGMPGGGNGRGSGIAFSDSTGNVVSSGAKIAARSADKVARERLKDALGDLRACQRFIDHGWPRDRDTYDETVPSFDQPVTRDQLQQSHQAARRREARGEL